MSIFARSLTSTRHWPGFLRNSTRQREAASRKVNR
jgi:hypothetical protein